MKRSSHHLRLSVGEPLLPHRVTTQGVGLNFRGNGQPAGRVIDANINGTAPKEGQHSVKIEVVSAADLFESPLLFMRPCTLRHRPSTRHDRRSPLGLRWTDPQPAVTSLVERCGSPSIASPGCPCPAVGSRRISQRHIFLSGNIKLHLQLFQLQRTWGRWCPSQARMREEQGLQ